MKIEKALYINGNIIQFNPHTDLSNPHSAFTDDSECFLDYNQPVEMHGTKLPHWNQSDTCFFVTFRLADSLPVEVRENLLHSKDRWLKLHPQPWDDATFKEYRRSFSRKIELLLDNGYGSCQLRNLEAARVVCDILGHDDGVSYVIISFVVMPNHVHVLLYPLGENKIEHIVQGWKSVSSHRLKRLYGEHWCKWMEKYHDRLIRNYTHLRNCINYIYKNYASGGVVIGGNLYSHLSGNPTDCD